MVSIADEIPGESIFKSECVRCHAEGGIGTQLAPDPLLGDLSLNQLAAYIDEAMPEDDPSKVTGGRRCSGGKLYLQRLLLCCCQRTKSTGTSRNGTTNKPAIPKHPC